MLRLVNSVLISSRSYKNFGHKRQPIPTVSLIWHGFLTFSFIGMCLNWERLKKMLFGDNDIGEQLKDLPPWEPK